jgi:hypothetical protein
LLGIRKSLFICSNELGKWKLYVRFFKNPAIFESLLVR